MRTIANEAGVSLGTVSHYGRKEELFGWYAERLATSYLERRLALDADCDDNPQESFFRDVDFLVDDLKSERGAKLFPELWAMASHHPAVQRALDLIYEHEREWLSNRLKSGWPHLKGNDVKMVVGVLIPLIEGQGVFTAPLRTPVYQNYNARKAVRFWLSAVLSDLSQARRNIVS